jgi:two-component system phosphate regulon response regulator OmpR
MQNILVIDDDERLLALLVQLLGLSQYFVKGARSAKEARAALSCMKFDAIIVDWMMPNESGIEFVNILKESTSIYSHIPTIMLTAMDNIENKLEGFNAGFDDYITKPFDERELLARLHALLKRNKVHANNEEIINFGDCSFNLITGELTKSSMDIYLTSSEQILLRALCQNPNHPFSRDDLAHKLGFIVNKRTVDVQITRLRKKIGDNPKAPTIIQTARHIGYLIVDKKV